MSEQKNEVTIWAIVPAAGSGQRMASKTPKQYLKLHDKTVIEHSLLALLAQPRIKELVVCVSQHDTDWNKLAISKQERISQTVGGSTRAHSVFNGLQFLASKAKANDWVLVHDAARPCLTQEALNRLIDQLKTDSVGGLLAVPSKDTLKQAVINDSGDSRVQSTINRSSVWRAQTPQLFRYDILQSALQSALSAGVNITDEASAIEYAGKQAKLVLGDESNIKITTPDDLRFAQLVLQT